MTIIIRNKFIPFFISLIIIVLGSGCNLRIGETAFVQNMDSFSLGCLNGMRGKMNNYISGTLHNEEITQIADCTKQALNIFKYRVRGQTPDVFTPDELRKFIQNLFLRDQTINDNFLGQIMRLKYVIIGGPEDKLTKEDIEKFIAFVDVLKTEAIFFQPYIQALMFPEQSIQLMKENKLKTDPVNLQKSATRLSTFLKRFSNPYYFTDIKNLMYELDIFSDVETGISHWNQRIEVVTAFKQFIVGGSELTIQPNEWEKLLPGYAYLLSALINYRTLIEHPVYLSPQGMQFIFAIVENLLNFLNLSLNNRLNKIIPIGDFIQLTPHLYSTQILSTTISKQSIYNLLKILLAKVLHTDNQTEVSEIILNPEKMKKLQEIFDVWLQDQLIINTLYNGDQESTTFPQTTQDLLSKNKWEWTKFENKQSKEVFMLKPLYKEENRIHISHTIFIPETAPELNFKNLTIQNAYRLLTFLLRSGYERNYPNTPGITVQELHDFFVDFQSFAIDMKWLARKSNSSISPVEASFIASNMFIRSSTGFNTNINQTEYLQPYEGIEYLSYLFSIISSIREFEQSLTHLCPGMSSEMGVLYDRACVKLHFISILENQIPHIPDLLQNLQKMSTEQKMEFTETLILIGFENYNDYQSYEVLRSFHIRNMFIALYFLETIFTRFDFNNDSILQHDELWSAFFLFEGFISRTLHNLLCQDLTHLSPSIYAYIIHNSEVPNYSQANLWSKLNHYFQLHWHEYNGKNHWKLQINNREHLIRIISMITKSYIREKAAKKDNECI